MAVLAIAGLILGCGGGGATAQAQTFAVSGRVLTSSGAALQGKNHFILISHGDHDGSTSGSYPIEEDGSFHCDLLSKPLLAPSGLPR